MFFAKKQVRSCPHRKWQYAKGNTSHYFKCDNHPFANTFLRRAAVRKTPGAIGNPFAYFLLRKVVLRNSLIAKPRTFALFHLRGAYFLCENLPFAPKMGAKTYFSACERCPFAPIFLRKDTFRKFEVCEKHLKIDFFAANTSDPSHVRWVRRVTSSLRKR